VSGFLCYISLGDSTAVFISTSLVIGYTTVIRISYIMSNVNVVSLS